MGVVRLGKSLRMLPRQASNSLASITSSKSKSL